MLTNWGYSVSTLPNILSVEEFNQRTANKYVLDSRIENTIASATSTIRNYVGWHLATNVACEIELTFDDLHIVRNGSDLLVQLPIRFFDSIEHIYLGARKENNIWVGDECPYSFKSDGIVKIYNAPYYQRYDRLVIQFTAGLTDGFVCKSSAGRVVRLLQPYDSNIYTGEPEELPAWRSSSVWYLYRILYGYFHGIQRQGSSSYLHYRRS